MRMIIDFFIAVSTYPAAGFRKHKTYMPGSRNTHARLKKKIDIEIESDSLLFSIIVVVFFWKNLSTQESGRMFFLRAGKSEIALIISGNYTVKMRDKITVLLQVSTKREKGYA